VTTRSSADRCHYGTIAHAAITSPEPPVVSSGGDQGGDQQDEPLGEKLHEMRKLEDALKYLENTTTIHAFLANQLSTQALYDPANDSWHVTPKNDREATSGPDRKIWEITDAKEILYFGAQCGVSHLFWWCF